MSQINQKSFSCINMPNVIKAKRPDSFEINLPQKITTSKKLILTSPILAYFSDSHTYLHRKYSQNLDYSHSSNFLRKDSLCPNEDTNDNEENAMESEEDEYEDSEDEEKEDEYEQLNANSTYNTNYLNQQKMNIPHSDTTSKNMFPNIKYNLTKQFNLMTINQLQQQQRPRFNSGSYGYNNSNNYSTEMFGRKGWICNKCNNFNYDSRNKCNRCGDNRENSKRGNMNNSSIESIVMRRSVNNVSTNSKQFNERIGDWVCFNCKNLNFAFRTVCNRCQLKKEQSEMLTMQSNYIMNQKIIL